MVLMGVLASMPAKADKASALAAVKNDGLTVKDAMWSSAGWLYVGVLDTGQRRDGLANYFCSVLAEHGVTGTPVKVVDIAAVVREKQFRELGMSRCR